MTTLESPLSHTSSALSFASERLRDQDDVAMAAVRADPGAFRAVSPRLRGCRELLETAMQLSKHNIDILRFASDELRNDRELVTQCIKQGKASLLDASRELQTDRDFVLEAIRLNGSFLEHASHRFRDDDDVVECACSDSMANYCFASERIRSKPALLKRLVLFLKENPEKAKVLMRNIPTCAIDEDIALLMFELVDLDDFDLVRRIPGFVIHGEVWKSAKAKFGLERLLDLNWEGYPMKELALFAVRKNGCLYAQASRALRNDRDVVMAALQQDASVYYMLKKRWQRDFDVRCAVKRALADKGI